MGIMANVRSLVKNLSHPRPRSPMLDLVPVYLRAKMIAIVKTHRNVVQQIVEQRVVWKPYK